MSHIPELNGTAATALLIYIGACFYFGRLIGPRFLQGKPRWDDEGNRKRNQAWQQARKSRHTTKETDHDPTT